MDGFWEPLASSQLRSMIGIHGAHLSMNVLIKPSRIERGGRSKAPCNRRSRISSSVGPSASPVGYDLAWSSFMATVSSK
jgi:hypothetical protein